jgi:hypothetical protein
MIPEATISGWAIAVSVMVSWSLVVPWAIRSIPAISDHLSSWTLALGNSSHGSRKPGFWEP